MAETSIEIKGLDRLKKAFTKYPAMVKRSMTMAGADASKEILSTSGLGGTQGGYPGLSSGNRPPTPYYIRGVGTQYASFNAGNSERYGTKWATKTRGYRTVIGNVTSYAPYLVGDKNDSGGIGQADAMRKIGWKKLTNAVKEKISKVVKIYQGYVNDALRKAGL